MVRQFVIGGGGGCVGGAAIGVLAKSLGAIVTAICSTRDIKQVSSPRGEDHVIDRQKTDITKMESIRHKYDIVFDTTSKYSIWKGST